MFFNTFKEQLTRLKNNANSIISTTLSDKAVNDFDLFIICLWIWYYSVIRLKKLWILCLASRSAVMTSIGSAKSSGTPSIPILRKCTRK